MEGRPRLAIVGGGFAGLSAIRTLAKEPVDVILIDRHNYHTFSPLLYQIGAAELEAAEIAYPLRKYLRDYPNVQFIMDEVERIDLINKFLECRSQRVSYDYLILASGSVPFYFGVPGAEQYALPLKTVADGVEMRNHILTCFEEAVYEPDSGERRCWLTFTVVGGGPTGVEFVCALAELINGPISRDHPRLDLSEVSLVLIEAKETVLAAMPPELRDYAVIRLAKKGVEVRSGSVANEICQGTVRLKSGEVISTRTVIWTAGVQAGHLARSSGVEVNEKNQVKVGPTLEVPGSPGFYAAGDAAVIADQEKPLPMVAPVATQQGETAARNVLRQIRGNDRLARATVPAVIEKRAASYWRRWRYRHWGGRWHPSVSDQR